MTRSLDYQILLIDDNYLSDNWLNFFTAGTTSLHEYLRRTNGVGIPRLPFEKRERICNKPHNLDLFGGTKGGNTTVEEAATSYLLDLGALKNMFKKVLQGE